MNINEKIITLMMINGIGRKRIKEIDAFLLKNEDVLITELLDETGLKYSNKSISIQRIIDNTKKIMDFCYELNIKIINFIENKFLSDFKYFADFPVILFIKGNDEFLTSFDDNYAVIGTRKALDISKDFAVTVGKELALSNKSVISGLAVGCDTAAHLGCLKGNGKTIAVMPCGLDKIYPPINKRLAFEIVENGGALVCEYLPFSSLEKWQFIERDRLQAAFSKKIFVAETGGRDGTMHTVRYAIKYKRELYCFRPEVQYFKSDFFSGNRKLIESKKATGISDIKSIKAILNKA